MTYQRIFEVERERLLREALARVSVAQVAREFGVSRSTIYRWMERYGIRRESVVL